MAVTIRTGKYGACAQGEETEGQRLATKPGSHLQQLDGPREAAVVLDQPLAVL